MNTFRATRKAKKIAQGTHSAHQFSVSQDGKLNTSPLLFELTAVCNAKCPGCFPQYLDLPQGFVDIGLIKETITNYARKGGQTLCLTARGEPLLDKRIPDVVKHAKDIGIPYVEFTSNGQLLNQKMARRLIDSGLDVLRISMTGSKQDIYEKWQGFDSKYKLEQVENNVLRFISQRNAMGCKNPKVFMRYIYDGQKDNVDAVAYLRKWIYHVEDVQFTMRLPVIHNGQAVEVENPEDIPSFFSSGEGKIRCPSVHKEGGAFCITSEGDLSLCPSAMGDDELSVGNLDSMPFDDLVSKYFEDMADLDRRMEEGNIENLPAACQSCFGIIEGGNNCQDFDVLMLMAVSEVVEKAKGMAEDLSRDIYVVGTTTASMMMMLNHDFSSRVKAVIDDAPTFSANAFSTPGVFKGIPIIKSLSAKEAQQAIIVISDDEAHINADKWAQKLGVQEKAIRYFEELKKINKITFGLPDLEGMYRYPWPLWHLQTQQNFYIWYLIEYLSNVDGVLYLSVDEYYKVDKLLQVSSLSKRTNAVLSIPGATTPSPIDQSGSMPGKDLIGLDAIPQRSDAGSILIWTSDEYEALYKWLVKNGFDDKFQIINYQSLLKRSKEMLAYRP